MASLIDSQWNEAEVVLSELSSDDKSRLVTAISATDAVWDRNIFDHATSFGGPEVGDSRSIPAIPEKFDETVREMAEAIPRINLFGLLLRAYQQPK